jgi:hypothetical protein
LPSVILGGSFVKLGASDRRAQCRSAEGRGPARRCSPLRIIERQARYDLADVAATAKKDGAGYVLNGEKSLAIHGDVADKIVVSARVSGDQRAKNGIGLFPGRRQGRRRLAARLSHDGRAARRRGVAVRTSRSARTP